MATPSKQPPAKGSGGGSGSPAPDFAATMNKIQLLWDVRSRAATASLHSSSRTHTNNMTTPKTSGGAFSSLTSATSSSATQGGDRAALRRRQLEEEEAAFAEERALDPNAGIGTRSSTKPDANAVARGREDRMLRGRLLGKRRKAADGSSGPARGAAERYARDDDDDDEEPGRSGLGRAKKKPVHRETETDAEVEGNENENQKGEVHMKANRGGAVEEGMPDAAGDEKAGEVRGDDGTEDGADGGKAGSDLGAVGGRPEEGDKREQEDAEHGAASKKKEAEKEKE
ncbi:hypothetical protein DL762_007736 [Monosporascus cannonballus]|uniref:THO1-MOS11 C-terminal domain-containing protein n=1 Tax=Monosporascus cannonballus TaxID=155416 RepID=A0ABY0GY97_9PEZI|nr:hypothetical protein DL762_007736 [Monosporascus cannonballus]